MLARVREGRTRWTRWRRSRPFWAGAFAFAGGLTILLLPAGKLTVFSLPGTAGLAGFLIGSLITILGLLLWIRPSQHTTTGVTILLLGLASFLYTNLGGFLIGMLCSLIAGSLALAWTTSPEKSAHRHSRKGRQR